MHHASAAKLWIRGLAQRGTLCEIWQGIHRRTARKTRSGASAEAESFMLDGCWKCERGASQRGGRDARWRTWTAARKAGASSLPLARSVQVLAAVACVAKSASGRSCGIVRPMERIVGCSGVHSYSYNMGSHSSRR